MKGAGSEEEFGNVGAGAEDRRVVGQNLLFR